MYVWMTSDKGTVCSPPPTPVILQRPSKLAALAAWYIL